MRITVFMASSLDGFIADKNGSVEWLNNLSVEADPNEDYGYGLLLSKVDRLVMGSKTFNQVLDFGQWPYGDLPVIVLTRKSLPTSIPSEAKVSTLSGTATELYAQFVRDGAKHIYLDGGDIVGQFSAVGLVDEFIITQVPALLGDGIPLFNAPLPSESWETLRVQNYPNGFVQTHMVKKESAS